MPTKKSPAKKSPAKADTKTSAPDPSATDDPTTAVIAARLARRADTSGEGRTLDALGNEVSA